MTPSAQTNPHVTSAPAQDVERTEAQRTRFGAATLGAPPLSFAALPEIEPVRPRRRRWLIGLTVFVVLALIAGALLGGRIWGRHGSASVWMLTRDVAAGQALQATDLRSVRVADAVADGAVSTRVTPAGRLAARSLEKGQVLRSAQVGSLAAVPSSGSALVGLALPAGTAPLNEIAPGDPVAVLKLPPPPQATSSGAPAPVGRATTVLRRVEVISISGSGSGAVATVAVPQSAIAELAALSAANRIAIVRVP